jgi:drug/metabolite transporter (DMT)-like permease
MRFSPRAIGLAAAAVTVIVWTSFIVIARASAQHTLNPFDLAFVRFVGAGVVLLPWGAWLVHTGRLQGWLGLSPLSFRLSAVTGLIGGIAYAMVAYNAFRYAPAVHASALMTGSLPVWTAVLAAVFLKDVITPARATGLGLIVLGALLAGGSSLLQAFSGGSTWKGDLLFMAASFCWASYSVIARRYALDAVQATIALSVFTFMAYVPAYALLAALQVVPSRLAEAPAGEIIFQALFQGVGSVVVSGITFTRMLQYYGPVRSSMITAVVPGLSALGAVFFLGEPLSWNIVTGLALVTAGIVFGARAPRFVAPVPVAEAARP